MMRDFGGLLDADIALSSALRPRIDWALFVAVAFALEVFFELAVKGVAGAF